jgi:hypothetical protein
MTARHAREMRGLHGFGDRVRGEMQRHRDTCADPLQLLIARLTEQAHRQPVPNRTKEGIFLTPIWPESPRMVRNVQESRTLNPGQPLGLTGIKMRKHIRVKKDDLMRNTSGKKKKKRAEAQ